METTEQLKSFITEAVVNNYIFPAIAIGGKGVTIQELMHNYTLDSLERYADRIEAEAPNISRSERRRTKASEKMIPYTNVSYTQFLGILDLIIKKREEEIAEVAKQQKIKKITDQLKSLQTPEEQRRTLEQELANLQKEAAPSSAGIANSGTPVSL